MKFNTLLVFLFAILFIAGCTSAPTTPPTDEATETGAVVDADDNGEDANETGDVKNDDDDNGTGDAEGTGDADDDIRTISITAKRWEYLPNTVTVKKGEKVKLVITDSDTKHGAKFDTMVVTEVDGGVMLDTSTVGTFTFSCPTFCGEGHKEMKGTVVVTE